MSNTDNYTMPTWKEFEQKIKDLKPIGQEKIDKLQNILMTEKSRTGISKFFKGDESATLQSVINIANNYNTALKHAESSGEVKEMLDELFKLNSKMEEYNEKTDEIKNERQKNWQKLQAYISVEMRNCVEEHQKQRKELKTYLNDLEKYLEELKNNLGRKGRLKDRILGGGLGGFQTVAKNKIKAFREILEYETGRNKALKDIVWRGAKSPYGKPVFDDIGLISRKSLRNIVGLGENNNLKGKGMIGALSFVKKWLNDFLSKILNSSIATTDKSKNRACDGSVAATRKAKDQAGLDSNLRKILKQEKPMIANCLKLLENRGNKSPLAVRRDAYGYYENYTKIQNLCERYKSVVDKELGTSAGVRNRGALATTFAEPENILEKLKEVRTAFEKAWGTSAKKFTEYLERLLAGSESWTPNNVLPSWEHKFFKIPEECSGFYANLGKIEKDLTGDNEWQKVMLRGARTLCQLWAWAVPENIWNSVVVKLDTTVDFVMSTTKPCDKSLAAGAFTTWSTALLLLLNAALGGSAGCCGALLVLLFVAGTYVMSLLHLSGCLSKQVRGAIEKTNKTFSESANKDKKRLIAGLDLPEEKRRVKSADRKTEKDRERGARKAEVK